MSNWCLYPNQCGPGMDCSKCYENRVKQLQSDNERLQKRVSELEGLLDTANGFLVSHPDFKAKVEQAYRILKISNRSLGESNE